MCENGCEPGSQNDPHSDDRMDVSEPTLSDKELDSPDTDAEEADLGSLAAAASSSSSTEKDVNSITSDRHGTLDNQDRNIDNREQSVDNRDKIAENWDSNVDNRSSNDLPQMSPVNRSQSTSGVNFGGVLDLELPSSGSYQAETVDFPSSPKQMKLLAQSSYGAQGMAMPQEELDNAGTMEDGDDDEDDPSTYRAILSPGLGDVRLKKDAMDNNPCETKEGKREASDGESDLEDYYEDYHMPLTHQNIMSRQKSFRRKMKQTNINMPDADRIENIIKSGELRRHGSIRRKIVPHPADLDHSVVLEDPLEEESPARQGSRDCVSENDNEVVMEHIKRLESILHEDSLPTCKLKRSNNWRQTSTPDREGLVSFNGAVSPILDALCENEAKDSDLEDLSVNSDTVAIDQKTVDRIRECFNKQRYKDNYTLSGHLKDILTPAEIEEIVSNSLAYSSVLDNDVMKVLFWSYSNSALSTNDMSVQTPSEKKKIAVNGDLDESLGMVLGDRKKISATFDDVSGSLRRSYTKAPQQQGKEKLPENCRLESRSSCRKRNRGMVVEGLFIESNASSETLNRKRVSAPSLDLDESGTSNNSDSLMTTDSGKVQFEKSDRGDKALPVSSLTAGLVLGVQNLQNWTPAEDSSKAIVTQHSNGLTSHMECNGLANVESTIVAGDIERSHQNSIMIGSPERPSHLGRQRKKKILVNEDILSAPDVEDDTQSIPGHHSTTDEATMDGETADLTFDDEDGGILTPDIETPDEMEESIAERLGNLHPDPIPEYTAAEEYAEERSWRKCIIAGIERRIDMKVIEPYKKVLSHGGYLGDGGHNAIIVFSACYLPDRSRRDYDYVMDNLFLYVLTTLDQLVAEDYILIYLHGATLGRCMPTFGWLKRCYQMIDRRLRKNLKGLYLVHPTFWLKTIVLMTRPFISSKFSRKLRFVNNLDDLSQLIPMDQVCIPDRVKQLNFQLMIQDMKRKKGIK